MKNYFVMVLLSLLIVGFSGCDDNEDTPQEVKAGDILISSMLPNPDGVSGSAYMQLIDNLNPAEYKNTTAFPSSYSVPPIVIGNDVFVIPGWSNQNSAFKKYSWSEGKLLSKGEYTLPSKSGAVSCVTKGNKAYVSLSHLGKILVIDHIKMEKLIEIDLSEYGIGDNNPDPAIMLIRDNLLYVGLNQLVGGFSPAPTRAKVDMLIVDTNTNKPLKMITDSKSGMSMPTKPEADSRSIFMDENKDIYINCISGFGFLGHSAGFLRIKAGETEFDSSYKFDVTKTIVDGDEFKPSYLTKVQYAGNGILYATGHINERYSKPEPNYLKDKTIICLKVDLSTKTLKKLNLPNSTNYGMSVSAYKDKMVFGLVTEQDAGFYMYDTKTGEASTSAVIKIDGYPAEFCHFGEKY
ncbi:hypothetical protein EMN47_16440 [Prolixibacteraceae bacterium JC049]|nr:hypothetical protein [Prolixibacteraceae bacterium JC049]